MNATPRTVGKKKKKRPKAKNKTSCGNSNQDQNKSVATIQKKKRKRPRQVKCTQQGKAKGCEEKKCWQERKEKRINLKYNPILSIKAVNKLKYSKRCKSRKIYQHKETMIPHFGNVNVMPKKNENNFILSIFLNGCSDSQFIQCSRTLPIKSDRCRKKTTSRRITTTISHESDFLKQSKELSITPHKPVRKRSLMKCDLLNLSGSCGAISFRNGHFSNIDNFQRSSPCLPNVLSVYKLKIELEKKQEAKVILPSENTVGIKSISSKNQRKKQPKQGETKSKQARRKATSKQVEAENNDLTHQDLTTTVIEKQESAFQAQSCSTSGRYKYTNNVIMYAIRSDWKLTKSEANQIIIILNREWRSALKLLEVPHFHVQLHYRKYLEINCTNSYSCLWLYDVHSKTPELYKNFHLISENELHTLKN